MSWLRSPVRSRSSSRPAVSTGGRGRSSSVAPGGSGSR
jgi:hypothetical protein